MTLQDILRDKGSNVYTIRASSTLDDAVQALVQHNCGSLVVCDPPRGGQTCPDSIQGIITERDILKASAARAGALTALRVSDYMTRNLIAGRPADSVEQTMGLLTEKRIRHLPILDDGKLVGIISIGDVVKAQHRLMAQENHYLKTYIQG